MRIETCRSTLPMMEKPTAAACHVAVSHKSSQKKLEYSSMYHNIFKKVKLQCKGAGGQGETLERCQEARQVLGLLSISVLSSCCCLYAYSRFLGGYLGVAGMRSDR